MRVYSRKRACVHSSHIYATYLVACMFVQIVGMHVYACIYTRACMNVWIYMHARADEDIFFVRTYACTCSRTDVYICP